MNTDDLLKKLKLIVFDLDGTLLNDEGDIGRESMRLIKELGQTGVQFTFATGRLHSALVEYAEELNIRTPLISLDGALIKSYPDGKIIHQTFIKAHHIKKIITYSEQYLIKMAMCHADAIYYTEHNETIPDLIDKFGAKFLEIDSYDNIINGTLEIVMVSEYKEKLKFINKRLNFPYSIGLSTSYAKSHSNENLYYLEVRRSGSTKGSGLKRLIRHLGINIKHTAVIGDWYNDLSLFQTDAVKVALSNAVPDIRGLANIVTAKSNNEDGVSEFLEMVLRAKRG